ncbi:hypothetical protein [Mycolicibacterium goodii]|uniref:hypothetical protein n=1 Tax=Mycolicibacterium goodii TaxID=134601 RepID=UPI001BDCECE3|nr:hypothetical protein [Mycolicibacterium goodii]MBU8833632.1 hypothetical protein [Mycolicibacterium goodii]
MALITAEPKDLPTTNALDAIPDDLLGGPPPPAEIRMSGKILLTLENPPEPGDEIVLLIRLKVNGTGVDLHENDEEVPYRKAKLVTCWKPGTKEPQPKKTQAELDAEAEAEAAKDQPPLFGDDSEDLAGEELADAAGVDFEGGPEFSDGE